MECPKCSYETHLKRIRCPRCLSELDCQAAEDYAHLGYLQAKARQWREGGRLSTGLVVVPSRLAAEERERLAITLGLRPAAVPPPAVERPRPAPPPPREPRPLVPRWLTDQAPNLLLYLGAFLVVMAALVFVAASRETGVARMALLASFTGAFLAVGGLCYRFPRVRIAGYTFLAVGALLVPLNFAAAYSFILEKEGIDGENIWLSASIYSLLFYLLLAILGLGILYGVMSHAALVSAVAAAIAVSDLPVEWAPPVFVGLSVALLPALWWVPTGLRDTFRLPTLATSHLLVAASTAATFVITLTVEEADPAAVPITLAIATLFFALLALANSSGLGTTYGFLTHAGFASALAAGLVVLSLAVEWIPTVFAGVAIALLPFAWWSPPRLRQPFALPALAFAILSGGLFALEARADRGVPTSAILAVVGVALLALGFLFLLRRDWWQRAQEAAIYWWHAWET